LKIDSRDNSTALLFAERKWIAGALGVLKAMVRYHVGTKTEDAYEALYEVANEFGVKGDEHLPASVKRDLAASRDTTADAMVKGGQK